MAYQVSPRGKDRAVGTPYCRWVQQGASSHRQDTQPGGLVAWVVHNLSLTVSEGLGPLTLRLSLEGPLPKTGLELNLPSKRWPWATFGLGLLPSDSFPQVSFRPLAPGPESRHTTVPSMASCFHHHPSHMLYPSRTELLAEPCSGCSLLPLPTAKALSPSPKGQRSRILQSGPHTPPCDKAISAFTG